MSSEAKRFGVWDGKFHEEAYRLRREVYEMPDGWGLEVQNANFEVLSMIENFSGFPLEGSSVIDVGCGTGELFRYLKSKKVANYVGIDLLSEQVEMAKEKYPDGQFVQGNILDFPRENSFDFAFCSGAMSIKVPSGNYWYMGEMIKKMIDLSSRGIAFNYLTDSNIGGAHDVFCFNEDKVADVIGNLAPGYSTETVRTIIVAETSLEFENAVFMWKPLEA